MAEDELPTPERAVEAAIARVLASEQAARELIASARVDAAHIAERSRAAARALAERTERRVRHLRAAFERRTGAEVSALEAEVDALAAGSAPAAEEMVQLDRAVKRVAAQLTGASP